MEQIIVLRATVISKSSMMYLSKTVTDLEMRWRFMYSMLVFRDNLKGSIARDCF